MKIYEDVTLEGFEAWSGAVDTKARILEEGKGEEFESLIEDLYPDGLSDTELNDILWFESDSIYEDLGIKDEEELDKESEEELFYEKVDNLFVEICDYNVCSSCPLKCENYDCEKYFNKLANDNNSFLYRVIQDDMEMTLDEIEKIIEEMRTE